MVLPEGVLFEEGDGSQVGAAEMGVRTRELKRRSVMMRNCMLREEFMRRGEVRIVLKKEVEGKEVIMILNAEDVEAVDGDDDSSSSLAGG